MSLSGQDAYRVSLVVWRGKTVRWEVGIDEALAYLVKALQEEGGDVAKAEAKLRKAFEQLKRK